MKSLGALPSEHALYAAKSAGDAKRAAQRGIKMLRVGNCVAALNELEHAQHDDGYRSANFTSSAADKTPVPKLHVAKFKAAAKALEQLHEKFINTCIRHSQGGRHPAGGQLFSHPKFKHPMRNP